MADSPTRSADLSRRQMLRRIGMTALIAGPGVTMLGACATSGGGDTKSNAVKAGKDPVNPFGVQASAPLEVIIFKGGLGDGYATQVHEPAYHKKFPQAKIKHTGIQEIGKTVRPRLVGGNPPDMVSNAGSDLMDAGALVAEGQLLDLTPLFDAPSIDDPAKKVRDLLIPGAVEAGLIDGKPYQMMYVASSYGLWYDAKLFQKEGWTAPKTFDEFKAVCEKIKAKGITPYAYAGKNAAYYQYWMILISAAKLAGNEILVNIDNLADGAWTADAVKQSAAAWAEIGKLYMDKSYLGLMHTEVQTQQNEGKIAFYPSGSWLENEQAKQTPKGFEYAVAPTPSLTASDKMPYEAIRTSAGEAYFVAAKGKNTAGAMEYLRIMLSKEGAKGFYEKSGNIPVVAGAVEGLQLTPGNQSVLAARKAAGDSNVVTKSFFEEWYKELETELRTQTNELMFGRITADQFCASMQKKADSVKKDSSVKKQQRSS
ncbi:MAG TPA: N-acetylglucosamine/diacetylchitobiose ABC transporter substrate-binding protein [Actinomadura sp.]|nr:N-acetylglucosamine/diacetylchitobiose ABC transporter substrate-binding protein [Actinomadura sp.]